MYQLSSTSIPVNFTTKATAQGYQWDPSDVETVFKGLMISLGSFLADKKSKTAKTAIKVQDTSGPLLLAGIVEYHEGIDEETPGNYSFTLTNNAEDLEGIQNIFDISNMGFEQVALFVAFNDMKMQFGNYAHLHKLFVFACQCLTEWLDEQAKEGEVVDIEVPGYIVASVGIEDGAKVMSFTVGSNCKVLIKDDASIEK